jgi:hypothetical protein
MVREHEESTNWCLKEPASELYRFFDIFNKEHFEDALPLPVLTFKRSRQSNLGHFHTGRNDIGAQYEINLNAKHIERPMILNLVTLLHEMVHLAQNFLPGTYGEVAQGNHHGKKFRELTAQFGIPSSSRGCTEHVDDSFIAFCEKHGAPKLERKAIDKAIEGAPKKKGHSSLKKWACRCGVNVRVAIEDFQATCDICHSKFKREE